jgi:membrane protein
MVTRRIKNVLKQFEAADIQLVAASLSYSSLLALIPFIAVCLYFLQAAGGLDFFSLKIEEMMLSNFRWVIGADGIRLFQSALKRASSAKIGTLGAIVLILTSMRLVWEMDRGFHRVFGIKNKRSIFTRTLQYSGILSMIPFLLASYVALVNTKQFEVYTGIFPTELRNFVVLTLVLTFAYKAIPSIAVDKTSAVIGAVVSAAGLMMSQNAFKFLTREVFNYSKLYGSIAAIPVLMIWIYIIWLMILFGAGLTAAFNKKDRPLL